MQPMLRGIILNGRQHLQNDFISKLVLLSFHYKNIVDYYPKYNCTRTDIYALYTKTWTVNCI